MGGGRLRAVVCRSSRRGKAAGTTTGAMRPVGRSSTGGWFFGITPPTTLPGSGCPPFGGRLGARGVVGKAAYDRVGGLPLHGKKFGAPGATGDPGRPGPGIPARLSDPGTAGDRGHVSGAAAGCGRRVSHSQDDGAGRTGDVQLGSPKQRSGPAAVHDHGQGTGMSAKWLETITKYQHAIAVLAATIRKSLEA